MHPMGVDTRAELIQSLIPIGLWHVKELLEQKVRQLARVRYRAVDRFEKIDCRSNGDVIFTKATTKLQLRKELTPHPRSAK